MIEIEVDFNMYDEGFFLAVTDDHIEPDTPFVAFDLEGHRMMAIAKRVENGVVYFAELDMPPLDVAAVTPSGITWSDVQFGEQRGVQAPSAADFVFEHNRPERATADA